MLQLVIIIHAHHLCLAEWTVVISNIHCMWSWICILWSDQCSERLTWVYMQQEYHVREGCSFFWRPMQVSDRLSWNWFGQTTSLCNLHKVVSKVHWGCLHSWPKVWNCFLIARWMGLLFRHCAWSMDMVWRTRQIHYCIVSTAISQSSSSTLKTRLKVGMA